jgi:hypothetical protein
MGVSRIVFARPTYPLEVFKPRVSVNAAPANDSHEDMYHPVNVTPITLALALEDYARPELNCHGIVILQT